MRPILSGCVNSEMILNPESVRVSKKLYMQDVLGICFTVYSHMGAKEKLGVGRLYPMINIGYRLRKIVIFC